MPKLKQEQKEGDWRTVCPYCEEEITGDTKEEVIEKEGRHRADHFDGQDQSTESDTGSVLKTGRNILEEYASGDYGDASLDVDPDGTYYLFSRSGTLHRPKPGGSNELRCGHSKGNMEKVVDVDRLNPSTVRKCNTCFTDDDRGVIE